jgi:hypothetical protein
MCITKVFCALVVVSLLAPVGLTTEALISGPSISVAEAGGGGSSSGGSSGGSSSGSSGGGYTSIADMFDGGGPGTSSNDGFSQGPDPSSPFNDDGNKGYSTPNQAKDAGNSYCGSSCTVTVHQDTDGGYNTSLNYNNNNNNDNDNDNNDNDNDPVCSPTSCVSAPNSCGMTNSGSEGCGSSCSATTPPESSCPTTDGPIDEPEPCWVTGTCPPDPCWVTGTCICPAGTNSVVDAGTTYCVQPGGITCDGNLVPNSLGTQCIFQPAQTSGDGDGGGVVVVEPPACIPVQVSCRGSASALCGDTYGGARNSCGGPCSALPFPDTECRDKPLPADALSYSPELIRISDTAEAEITWNTGTNHQNNCTLKGSGLPPGFAPGSLTGSVTAEPIKGPHQYTLSCGPSDHSSKSVKLKVLPEMYES